MRDRIAATTARPPRRGRVPREPSRRRRTARGSSRTRARGRAAGSAARSARRPACPRSRRAPDIAIARATCTGTSRLARGTERPSSSARSGRPTPRSLSTMSGSWSLLPEMRRWVRSSRSASAKSPSRVGGDRDRLAHDRDAAGATAAARACRWASAGSSSIRRPAMTRCWATQSALSLLRVLSSARATLSSWFAVDVVGNLRVVVARASHPRRRGGAAGDDRRRRDRTACGRRRRRGRRASARRACRRAACTACRSSRLAVARRHGLRSPGLSPSRRRLAGAGAIGGAAAAGAVAAARAARLAWAVGRGRRRAGPSLMSTSARSLTRNGHRCSVFNAEMANRLRWPSHKEVRRCPTLPQGHPCSTIGAEGLSFRVRNVTGRFPFAMAAETLLIYVSFCARRLEAQFPTVNRELQSGREQSSKNSCVIKLSAY